MPIYKRGRIYWYHFWFSGQHVQRSTKQGNPRTARQMEAACKTALAKGEVGILERQRPPILREFSKRFIDHVQAHHADRPRTLEFYAEKVCRLLEFGPLATAHLDQIDEALIETYIQVRRSKVSPATVNRDLATLRRMLRLAQEWHVVDRVPKIRLLPGEHAREFVLSYAQEQAYLAACPDPLRDFALLDLDTGLRASEAVHLEWRDIHVQPVNGAKYGYLHVHHGKSSFARRNLPLTEHVKAMLQARQAVSTSPFVFPGKDPRKPFGADSLDHQHAKVRKLHRLPPTFVIHSLRHTFGTRLGEAGADAFTIMRLMGHSSVTVSQRYVHPTPEALERAVERLEALRERLTQAVPEVPKRQLLATVPATLVEM